MERWRINIELLTETIFGSGYSVPGSIDLEVVHDEYGLPYFKGKTFKGKLREEVENIAVFLTQLGLQENYSKIVNELFGEGDADRMSVLRFSDCAIKDEIKQYIIYGIKNRLFNKQEVLTALTDVRSFTSIDQNGIAEAKSLRKIRVINKGLNFLVKVEAARTLTQVEKGILAAGVSSLRHLGSMESRGKGEVSSRLWEYDEIKQDFQDVTDNYLNTFAKRVKGN